MFSKALILVLLGCALTLANPIPKNEKPIFQPKHDVNIGLWLQNAHEEITQIFRQAVEPFEKTYYSLVEAGKNGHKYSIDQIEQLRSVFHEITDKGREQISDIEVAVLTNTIGNLQNAVEYLSMRFSSPGIEQGTQLINRNIQAGQETVVKGNKNLQEIVSQKTNSANDKIDLLQNSGGFFDEVGNTVKGAISSGVENVKGWASNGIKFVEGIANKIGSDAQEVLDNGKNAIDNGVDNVKEQVSHGGNGFGSTEAVKEFGNKAQNPLNNEMLKVRNQYNQYVPSAIGVESYQENIYDGKSALDKISKQLTGAIAVHMNEVLKNLVLWRNIVENYLASSGRKVELHAQAMNEEMGHVIGNHGQLFGVVREMNNVKKNVGRLQNIPERIDHEMLSGVSGGNQNFQKTFGQLTNVAEGIGHGMLPGVAEGIKNVQGTFGKLTNMAEGMGHGVVSGVADGVRNVQGTFGKLTNIAEGMGHGVVPGVADGMKTVQEKLQNIAERLGNNIQGSVGMKPPNVAEGISNIQGRFGNFPNFVEEVEGSFQTNSVGDIVNMSGATERMPKIDKDLVSKQPSTDYGRFKKIGQKLGGHIGGHIDTFTNILGGLWKNAANMFGI